MVGGVDVEDAPLTALGAIAQQLLEHGIAQVEAGVAVLHAQLGVAEDAEHVVVAEHRPRAEGALVHAVLLAQGTVLRVGVVEESRHDAPAAEVYNACHRAG